MPATKTGKTTDQSQCAAWQLECLAPQYLCYHLLLSKPLQHPLEAPLCLRI